MARAAPPSAGRKQARASWGTTPWRDPERYRKNSPLYRFDRIETPVLIGQGEVDLAAPMYGASAVFVALRRLGKPVEYRVYEGEGHGIGRAAQVIDFWQRRLTFLAERLNIETDAEGRVILESGRVKARSSPAGSGGERTSCCGTPASQPDLQGEVELE